jgi:UDP-N-acetylglucosamine--N-acetylmuramyl-(pentapeptide) pyrophosphoryl-undecaprenol N-acetylglucosamine transferase
VNKKIIIAGGGTGGHIFPAVAIAHALRKLQPSVEILFVGAKGKMEMEKVPQAGYEIKGLDIAGFNRSSLIKNIGLPLKLIKSFWQVRNISARCGDRRGRLFNFSGIALSAGKGNTHLYTRGQFICR